LPRCTRIAKRAQSRLQWASVSCAHSVCPRSTPRLIGSHFSFSSKTDVSTNSGPDKHDGSEPEAEYDNDEDADLESKEDSENEEEDDDLGVGIDAEGDFEAETLSESDKFLIHYRKSQGLQYAPSADSEFVYKPLPRMPGPSPFINQDYKRLSVAKYHGLETLELPVSSVMPLGGIPEIWVHSSNATKRSIYQLSPDLFNQDVRIDLLWRCVRYERHKNVHWTWYIARHRGEIWGSGKKLRQQKGTGRARMSDGKAPQFRGGGKAHGRRPKSMESYLKKYSYHKGIKIALTARYQEGDLFLWDDFVLPRLERPEYLRNLELYEKERVNKHPELGEALVPIDELDWNDNTKLYYDVYRTRQMLNKWGWLKPQLYERVNDHKTFRKIMSAKKVGNIVDILEAMPIAEFEWDFLKEEDEMVDHCIPTVLLIHDGYVQPEFERAVSRVHGVDLMEWKDIVGDTTGDGKRHTPRMGVFRLLKYKKIVFSVTALKNLEQAIGIEAEVERWNYYAQLNRIRQSERARDAFPKEQAQKRVSLQ